jgi:hypothetical protein
MICIVIGRLWHTRVPIYSGFPWADTVEQRSKSLKISRDVEPWQLKFVEYERLRETKTQESESSAYSLPAPSVSVQRYPANETKKTTS